MHELSIVQGVVQVALDAAQQANAESIVAINLTIGDLTGVVHESVRFYFDFLRRDTLAAGAELRIRRRYATGRCADCGHVDAISLPIVAICPHCASERWQITGGRELSVESIEIEPAGSATDCCANQAQEYPP